MSAVGTRRDTRVRTRSSATPTFAVFEQATDRRPACDGCGDVATWRGPVEGVIADLCSDCKRSGLVP